jgi:hypothetical protein
VLPVVHSRQEAERAARTDHPVVVGAALDLAASVDAVRVQVAALAKQETIRQLQSRLKSYNDKVRRLAELATSHAAGIEMEPDKPFIENTAHFWLEVGQCGRERRVVDTMG